MRVTQPSTQTTEYRRKRKRVILLALVALILLTSPLWALSLRQPNGSGPVLRIVVQPGDTLWVIAKHYGPPERDVRSTIGRLKRINHLDDSQIHPGDVLLLPQK